MCSLCFMFKTALNSLASDNNSSRITAAVLAITWYPSPSCGVLLLAASVPHPSACECMISPLCPITVTSIKSGGPQQHTGNTCRNHGAQQFHDRLSMGRLRRILYSTCHAPGYMWHSLPTAALSPLCVLHRCCAGCATT